MSRNGKIIWGYLSELALSALVAILLIALFGADAVAKFSRSTASDFVGFVGAGTLAISITFLAVILQRLDSPFYRWLDARGALSVYQLAIKYVAFVSLASILVVLILKNTPPSRAVALTSLFFSILLVINVVTLLNNVTSIMRLESKFNGGPG